MQSGKNEMNQIPKRSGRIKGSGRFSFFLLACLMSLAWASSSGIFSDAQADLGDVSKIKFTAIPPLSQDAEIRPVDDPGQAAAMEDRIAGLTYSPEERMVYLAATGSPNRNGVTVQWETRTEPWTSGYFVWRGEKRDGAYARIHHGMILSKGGDTWGGFYTVDDYEVVSGRTYYYKVQEIENSGIDRFYGPVASDGSIDWDNCRDKNRVNISCFIGSLLF
jgi:hypothetical protein